jgi:hypothetical protein
MAKLVFGLNLSLDGYFLTDGDYCSRHLIPADRRHGCAEGLGSEPRADSTLIPILHNTK